MVYFVAVPLIIKDNSVPGKEVCDDTSSLSLRSTSMMLKEDEFHKCKVLYSDLSVLQGIYIEKII